MAPTTKYLLAIATYCRPESLQRLLDSLAASIDRERVVIVVVDNDNAASAKLVASEHPLRPSYEVEPNRGIASARNRGFAAFSEEFDAIIFVDDDEWVDASWFKTIIRYAETTRADVVQGPVVTVLPENAPHWIRRGSFFQRPVQATGTPLTSAATNNVLLTRRAWLKAGSPRFDHAFSTTGGSDFDLFWGIHASGATLRYCAEAIVFEDVPASRLTWTWLRRRYTRNGIVILHSRRKHGEPLIRFLVNTLGALLSGSVRLIAETAAGRGPQAASVERIFKSYGVFSGLVGHRIHEYQDECPRDSPR